MKAFHTIAVAAAALFVSGVTGNTAHAQLFGNLPFFGTNVNNNCSTSGANGNVQCGPNGCWTTPGTNSGVSNRPNYYYGNTNGQNVPYLNNAQRYPTTYPSVGNTFPNGPVPYSANRPDFGNYHNHNDLNRNNGYYSNSSNNYYRLGEVRDRNSSVPFQTPMPFQTFPVNYSPNGLNMR